MAAPEYVPTAQLDDSRTYASPPRRIEPWTATRPGDVVGEGQPTGPMLGSQGPDLGYALKLARTVADRVVLAEGEHLDDVIAGCTAVAMKRSSMFGRAPVVHDLTAALSIFGFLGEAPDDLVELRRGLFAEVASPHHWAERRHLVDLVREDALRQPHTTLQRAASSDWKRLLHLDDAA